MGLNLFGWMSPRHSRRPVSAQQRQARPTLDHLEERVVLASAQSLALPLSVNDVRVLDTGGVRSLVADVAFAGKDVATAVPLTLSAADGAGTVPVLNLHVGALDLNLLGLGVQTSDICLDITATPGSGLLGDLLGGLAGGLGGGSSLGDLLTHLGGQVNQVLGGIDRLLDRVLGSSMNVTGLFGQGVNGNADPAPAADGTRDILNLSLGPVNLNLLGLGVSLDDCNGGPVTVDVTADPAGGVLGGLLAGLADGINLDNLNVGRLIGRIDNLFDRVGNILDRVGDITGPLSDRITNQLGRLVDQLQRTVDRLQNQAGELRNLQRVIDQLGRLADRIDALGDRLDAIIDRLQGLLGGSTGGTSHGHAA